MKPLTLVGFGSLVRNRRLASAILKLTSEHAYEARLLMRSMIEIHTNYAWIRLRKAHSRATRYLRFEAAEQYRLLQKWVTVFRPADHDARLKHWAAERGETKHLFYHRDEKGRLRWDKTWASVSSLESRMIEIHQKEKPGEPFDPFVYGMYVWFSSTTHGGPSSVKDVVVVREGRLSTSRQPEKTPRVHLFGAVTLLAWTIEAFAEDARLRRALKPVLVKLRAIMKIVGKGASPGTGRKAENRGAGAG
jgi:hypothetical protein